MPDSNENKIQLKKSLKKVSNKICTHRALHRNSYVARRNNSYKSSKLHYFASSFLLLPKKLSHLYVTLFMISLYLFHKKLLRKKMKNDRKYMYQTWVRPRQSVRTFPTIYVKSLQSTVTPLPLLLPPSSFFPNYRVYPTPWNFRRIPGECLLLFFSLFANFW